MGRGRRIHTIDKGINDELPVLLHQVIHITKNATIAETLGLASGFFPPLRVVQSRAPPSVSNRTLDAPGSGSPEPCFLPITGGLVQLQSAQIIGEQWSGFFGPSSCAAVLDSCLCLCLYLCLCLLLFPLVCILLLAWYGMTLKLNVYIPHIVRLSKALLFPLVLGHSSCCGRGIVGCVVVRRVSCK